MKHARVNPQRGLALLVLLLTPAGVWGEDTGKQLYKTHCAACHQASTAEVGPSLHEIAKIYKQDASGVIQWSIKPGRKRTEGIEMPAMGYVGEDNLKLIADYMLRAGAKAKKPKNKRWTYFKEELGIVQRTFMPGSSPASIAVMLPGGLSFCWDADNCYLRYFWRGGLDPAEQFTGNGSSLPRLAAPPFHTSPGQPFVELSDERAFLGYDLLESGQPVFRYRVGDCEIQEHVASEGDDIVWTYRVQSREPLVYRLPEIAGYNISADRGMIKDGTLRLTAEQAARFTLRLAPEGGQP